MVLLSQPVLPSHTWDLIMKELSDRELDAASITGAVPPRLGGGPQRDFKGGTSHLPDRRNMNPSTGDLPPPDAAGLRGDPTNIDRQKVASLIHQVIQQQHQKEQNAREVASTPSSRVPSNEEQRQNLPSEVFEPHQPPRGTRVIPEWEREERMSRAGPAHGLPEIGEEEQFASQRHPPREQAPLPSELQLIFDKYPEGHPNTPIEVDQLRAIAGMRGGKVGVKSASGATQVVGAPPNVVGVRGQSMLFPSAPGPDDQARGS